MPMTLVLFARVGWMRLYKGPQVDDEKPIGGGKYNQTALGNEAFNFLPHDGELLGYFQPKLAPSSIRKAHPSHIALERIQKGFTGSELKNVLTIFVATDPALGAQRIVGWFRNSTVYRLEQKSTLRERQSFSYFIKAAEMDAVLVPAERRDFIVPGGKGAFGQANVCYPLDASGEPKEQADWIAEALDYVKSYALENAAQDPESETDADIAGTISGTLEHAAGFQSNPRIRRVIEVYAMEWACRHLVKLKYSPKDTHKNKPYDFVCEIDGKEVYVEVKGMQDSGESISLTPREVEHAQTHKTSALFIVHSVKVKGKRKPVVSGGKAVFRYPWDITKGTLKPRGFVLTIND
jgi:hypothetical protein